MNQLRELYQKHKEIIMYTIMGVSATGVNWLAYSILVSRTGIALANALSWCITLVFAFVTNKVCVFESKSWRPAIVFKEGINFTASRGVTGFLEVYGQPKLYALGLNHPLFGVDGLVAKIVVCLSLVGVNYVTSKLLVFRNTPKKEETIA